MLVNPKRNEQFVVNCFSKKMEKNNQPSLTFNGDNVQCAISLKHLGLVFDSKLDFNEHINNNRNKYNEIISYGVFLFLARKTSLTVYKLRLRRYRL